MSRTRMLGVLGASFFAVAAAYGCGISNEGDLIAPGDDGGAEGGTNDGAPDGTGGDASPEAGGDASGAGVDATNDAGDGRSDAPLDAAPDVVADGSDGAADAPLDAPSDAIGDAPGDAIADAPADVVSDAPDAADAGPCDPVTASPPLYYVDPIGGSDTGTGSGTRGGVPDATCAFKTVTAALAAATAAPPTGTQVVVRGASTVGPGETWPLVVPAGLTVLGSGGTVRVDVPAGQPGFSLSGAASGLASLVIDGSTNTATSGVLVGAGSATTTTLSRVTVRGFLHHGVHVRGGTIAIGPGVILTSNGTASTRADGLFVEQGGAAIVNVALNQAPAQFDSNSGYGVEVTGTGTVRMTGAHGTTGNSIVISANDLGGIRVQQDFTATVGANLVDTVTVTGSMNGPGVWLFAGSNVKVRNVVSVGNATHGVLVETSVLGLTTRSDDVSAIDLGTGGDFGGNIVQRGAPGNNPGAGICLQLGPAAGQTLRARGNVFEPIDCSVASPGMLTRSQQCSGGTDVGVATSTNAIDVANCSY